MAEEGTTKVFPQSIPTNWIIAIIATTVPYERKHCDATSIEFVKQDQQRKEEQISIETDMAKIESELEIHRYTSL